MKVLHSSPLRLALVVFLVLLGSDACSQADTTAIYRVETRDGNEYVGRLISKSDSVVRLETQTLGALAIPAKDIVALEKVHASVRDGAYWFAYPQATRYFWMPNGYGLKRGEAYFQNVCILVNQFSVGVTDNLSFGAGLVPAFLIGGGPTPIWVTPKVSIPLNSDRVNLGAGALVGTIFGQQESGFGLLYSVVTFGSRDSNISVGLGYGFAGGDWGDNPTFSFSGMFRTGRRGYVLTENYVLSTGSGSQVLAMIGGRTLTKKTGIDYGLLIVPNLGELVAVPWLGITVPLRGKLKS